MLHIWAFASYSQRRKAAFHKEIFYVFFVFKTNALFCSNQGVMNAVGARNYRYALYLCMEHFQ